MREVWLRTRSNEQAILGGLAGTGRVITAAAAIMVAVFAAFIPSPDVVLKVIGVGMAAAIFIDATVVRMLLVPAVMHVLGKANWWMPAWLDRRIPELAIEGRPEVHMTVPHRPESATPSIDLALCSMPISAPPAVEGLPACEPAGLPLPAGHHPPRRSARGPR